MEVNRCCRSSLSATKFALTCSTPRLNSHSQSQQFHTMQNVREDPDLPPFHPSWSSARPDWWEKWNSEDFPISALSRLIIAFSINHSHHYYCLINPWFAQIECNVILQLSLSSADADTCNILLISVLPLFSLTLLPCLHVTVDVMHDNDTKWWQAMLHERRLYLIN